MSMRVWNFLGGVSSEDFAGEVLLSCDDGVDKLCVATETSLEEFEGVDISLLSLGISLSSKETSIKFSYCCSFLSQSQLAFSSNITSLLTEIFSSKGFTIYMLLIEYNNQEKCIF